MKLLTLLLTAMLSLGAFAIPNLIEVDPMFGPIQNAEFNMINANYDFEGIVGLSNCSAALIKFIGDENIDRKALVLTNGHCIGMGSFRYQFSRFPAPGEVFVDVDKRRKISLFSNSSTPVGSTFTTKLLYATMTDTDMGIYEAEMTYREIKEKYDIDPLILSDAKPEAGDPIEVLSGYWKRGYDCRMDAEIPKLKEGDWIWLNAIKYTQPGCETIGGTSGSPIINANDRTVVGVNNTGNNDDNKACSIMNPCEIDDDGNITDDDHMSYGQQTAYIYTCLDAKFNIDLDIDGCLLPKPKK